MTIVKIDGKLYKIDNVTFEITYSRSGGIWEDYYINISNFPVHKAREIKSRSQHIEQIEMWSGIVNGYAQYSRWHLTGVKITENKDGSSSAWVDGVLAAGREPLPVGKFDINEVELMLRSNAEIEIEKDITLTYS